MVDRVDRFFQFFYSDEFEVCDARMVNENLVEVQYRNIEEFAEQNNKVNVVIAAFTTAYARLKLYDLLDLLQERVLYYDTDSVIYVHKHDESDPPLSRFSTSEYCRAKRLFPFVLELSAETKWN